MAIYPQAIQKLIKPGANDPRLNVVVGSISHVAVFEGPSLYDWFNGPSGGVESHFYIRYSGVVEQYRDTQYEADAQGLGNSWVIGKQRFGYISIETEGLGSGTWTDEQLASLKALIKWINETHGAHWTKAPAYHAFGHGYHSQFSEWNPDHHACPGADRIQQFNTIVVPWLARNGKEIDLPLTTADVLTILNTPVTKKGTIGGSEEMESLLTIVTRSARNIEAVAALEKANSVEAITKAVTEAGVQVDPDKLATALAKAITELATG